MAWIRGNGASPGYCEECKLPSCTCALAPPQRISPQGGAGSPWGGRAAGRGRHCLPVTVGHSTLCSRRRFHPPERHWDPGPGASRVSPGERSAVASVRCPSSQAALPFTAQHAGPLALGPSGLPGQREEASQCPLPRSFRGQQVHGPRGAEPWAGVAVATGPGEEVVCNEDLRATSQQSKAQKDSTLLTWRLAAFRGAEPSAAARGPDGAARGEVSGGTRGWRTGRRGAAAKISLGSDRDGNSGDLIVLTRLPESSEVYLSSDFISTFRVGWPAGSVSLYVVQNERRI